MPKKKTGKKSGKKAVKKAKKAIRKKGGRVSSRPRVGGVSPAAVNGAPPMDFGAGGGH